MVVVMGLTVHSNRMPLIDSGPKLGTVMEGDLHDLPFASDGLSLLYIFHPGCSHCWNNVPRVETFANNGINVIGVMPSGIEANILDEFRTQVAPDFPYQELPMTEIDKLVPHGYPAALLIEDGRIVQKFRGDAIPSYPTFLKQK